MTGPKKGNRFVICRWYRLLFVPTFAEQPVSEMHSGQQSYCNFRLETLISKPKVIQVKGKVIPLHAMEAFGMGGGIAPTHS
jgi:hypothetical protein